jgi:hypothetical protein
VNNSPQNIDATLGTNAENGGIVYITGSNAGLQSSVASYTINAVSGNLAVLSQGFGAQGVSTTQTSGGPLAFVAPYDTLAGDTVGIIDQTLRSILDTSGPIVGGSGTFILKAKPSAITPAATDYVETLTVIASGRF